MTLKSILRPILKVTDISVVRGGDVYNSFEVLPLLVRAHLARSPEFFFVQVGANDGVHDDPLRELILEHHLTGILVEPIPEMFAKLVGNYATTPGLILENVAIAATSGRTVVYRATRPTKPGTGEDWTGLSGFDRRHLREQGVPDEFIEPVSVEAVTMGDLMARNGVGRIDLLQIDTEGHDDVIIESAFAANLLPEIINYEHCHLGYRRKIACKRLLLSKGYQFIEIGWKDTLAVRPEALAV